MKRNYIVVEADDYGNLLSDYFRELDFDKEYKHSIKNEKELKDLSEFIEISKPGDYYNVFHWNYNSAIIVCVN